MLTFEKVIEIFADYLAQDQELEVCKSRYGYVRVEFSGMEGPEDFLQRRSLPYPGAAV